MVEARGTPTSPSDPAGSADQPDTGAAAPPPALPRRLVQVFVSPGELFRSLAADPRWVTALLLGAALSMLSVVVIPGEMWGEMVRQSMLESGRPMPEGFDPSSFGTFQRVMAVVAGGLFWFVMAFVVAGVTTLVFAFLLGDEGRYRQHLSIVSHALLIMGVGALLTTPLRLAQGDVELTLNLGLFLPVEDGFLATFLQQLDLFWLWSFVVIGVGMHALDRRRATGPAVAIVMVVPLAFALLQAWIRGG